MKRFIIKFAVFIIPVPLAYAVLLHLGYLPILSDSLSYDAKMFKLISINKSVDILTIGSSVALNDINSQVIDDSLKLSYYNTAAWGVTINDLDNNLVKEYVEIFRPRYMILPSNFSDFNAKANESFADLNVSRRFLPYYYFKNFTGFYGLAQWKKDLAGSEKSTTGFTSLNFDANGGVALNVAKTSVPAARLAFINSLIAAFPGDEVPGNYSSLNSIAKYLKARDVKLIFVQVPFAGDFIKSKQKQLEISTHFNRCKSIVESNGGIYLDFATTSPCPDSVFADPLHLSGTGAIMLTQQLVKRIKNIVK